MVNVDTAPAAAGLNPCFSGTYSRRRQNRKIRWLLTVLILVLVEHTLGEREEAGRTTY